MTEKKKGNIQNLIPYVKGQSGNRSGRPKGLLTKDKVSKIISQFSMMTPLEIRKVAEDQDSTMIEIMIASIIMQICKSGDPSRLNFLFERSPVGALKGAPPVEGGNAYQQIMADLKKMQTDEA